MSIIKTVVKRDGSEQEFSPEKLNRWAEYATKTGGNWSEISLETYKRLPDKVKTSDIHQTMINVCLDKEQIEYSRVAARLEHARIRKTLDSYGIRDSGSFKDIYNFMLEKGVWSKEALPSYNPEWEDWYKDIYNNKLEYWQIKQWSDKYSRKLEGKVIETPHIGAMGIGLGFHGDTETARKLAKGIIEGKINLPTPALNGVRNNDFNTISCCVITGGDSVDSILTATHLSALFTSKKSGIGVELDTRSKGDPVKGGAVDHLGKHSLYASIDTAVKLFTQITRGGSATVTFKCIDPEAEQICLWKTQRVDVETRLDKIDYSMAYNNAFLEAVVKGEDWYLFSLKNAPEAHEAFYNPQTTLADYKDMATRLPHVVVKARDLLKTFLIARNETGRVYCFNVSRANEHTPFLDRISLSNLCQEICLPTKAYTGIQDLHSDNSVGETAFCVLSAINVQNVDKCEYEDVAETVLRTVDVMIDKAVMPSKSLEAKINMRRSVGVGITGLAGYLYKQGLDYDGGDESLAAVSELAERHYYYLLKASQKIAAEEGYKIEGVDLTWLPVDTRINKHPLNLDWEALRGKQRKHSVLVAHMPTASSATFSNATSGLYPQRNKVINNKSRKGLVQYICEWFEDSKFKSAWKVDNITLSKYYSVIQDMTDQGISADYYFDPSQYTDEKKPLSELMKEWVAQAKLGNKSMYYINTRDYNGGSYQDTLKSAEVVEDVGGCDSGGCKL